MAIRHITQKRSTSLVIREMKIKATVNYHFISQYASNQKDNDNDNLGRMWRHWNPHTLTGGNVNGAATLENSVAAP